MLIQQQGNRTNNYHYINELLTQRNSNPQLLAQIKRLELQNHASFTGGNIGGLKRQPNYQQINVIDSMIIEIGRKEFDFSPLLQKTSRLVIEQIGKIMIQNEKLSRNLQLQENVVNSLIDKIEILKEGLNYIGSGGRLSVLFEREKMEIQAEIEESVSKIQMINLMDSHIDSKLDHLRAKNSELRERQRQLYIKGEQHKQLLQEKARFEQQVAKLEVQKQNQERNQLTQLTQLTSQQFQLIRETLKYRLALQEQVLNDEVQKQQFLNILIQFQNKYEQVKSKHQKLSDKMTQLGKQLPQK